MRLFNTEILANPLNWLTVLVMVMFGFFLVAIVFPQD